MTGRQAILAYLVFALFMTFAGASSAEQTAQAPATSKDVPALLETLKKTVGLYGDIVAALKTKDTLRQLGKQDGKAVVPLIVKEVEAPRAYDRKAQDYRMALIEVLRDIGKPAAAAVPVLTEITEDQHERNSHIKGQASAALAAIGTPDAAQAAKAADRRTMRAWLQNASPEEIAKAVRQHSFFIRQELRSPNPRETIIAASVRGLLEIGDRAADAVPVLLQAHGDPRTGGELRAVIAKALKEIGVEDITGAKEQARAAGTDAGGLAAIIADTRSDDDLISGTAMMELGKRGPADAVIDALVYALEHGHNPGAAALVLGGFGPAAERAAPYLLPYIRDPAAGANAIQALGRIGARDEPIIAELSRLAAEEGTPQRAMAAAALGELKAVTAVPALIEALSDRDKYTAILTANALAKIGADAQAAVPRLTGLLDQPDKDVRRSAVQALGAIGAAAADAVPGITRQLQSSDRRLKDAAVLALDRIGGQKAAEALQADARRYERSDASEYQRLKDSGAERDAWRFVKRLPQARQVQVARVMLRDPSAAIAYTGAGFLIRAGLEKETVPVLADMIAAGKVETELDNRLGWDWRHGDDPALFERMMARIGDYLKANLERYGEEERERIRRVLGGSGNAQ
jgi:HEAT repeat protein